ncbi:hypothetical protein KJB25_22495, partial [Serratia marcescens]
MAIRLCRKPGAISYLPMNKPTQPAQDYLAALPLTAERSEALNPQTADDAQALEALHRQ